jgi:hypothetical protein
VRHSNEVIAEPQLADDLRGTRKKGNNAHEGQGLSLTSVVSLQGCVTGAA